MTPESKVKEQIKKLLKSYGHRVYFFMPAMNGYGKSGVADIVICANGVFISVEVKSDAKKNPPTALQWKNYNEVDAAGGVAMIIDQNNLSLLTQAIDAALERQNG